jgi:hypothetical protein
MVQTSEAKRRFYQGNLKIDGIYRIPLLEQNRTLMEIAIGKTLERINRISTVDNSTWIGYVPRIAGNKLLQISRVFVIYSLTTFDLIGNELAITDDE